MATAAEPKAPAGWSIPHAAKKAHWFPEGGGTSLCGRWLFFPHWRLVDPSNHATKDDCAVCRRRLDDKRGVGQ